MMTDEEELAYNTIWLDDFQSIQHRLYEDFDKFFPADKGSKDAKELEDTIYHFCKVLFLLIRVAK